MVTSVVVWIRKYERHLSALAMVAGFVVDNIFFDRVDLLQTHALLAGYAVACFVAIPLLQWNERRIESRGVPSRVSLFLTLVVQFALGGFWSAFVIFYGRSAVFGASWPFLLLLVLVFLGSEYFHTYHARLVFTSVLFFFALYSYAIFAVPVYTGTIGTPTFLLSTLVAIVCFALFTVVLRVFVRDKFKNDVWRIRFGALLVLLVMNLSYFTGVLPPLPLSAKAGGVYHLVSHVPGAYMGTTEQRSWLVRYLSFSPTLHIVSGSALYAYSSVFAPTALTTTVVHRWEHYDEVRGEWVTRARVSYPIQGGRDGGYRGYSYLPISEAGKWRVSIETSEGRVIDRLPFNVELVTASPVLETITLK